MLSVSFVSQAPGRHNDEVPVRVDVPTERYSSKSHDECLLAHLAMKQLNCVKGACALEYQPETVQCLNMGSDGDDIQWKCEAELNSRVKFGHIEVSCEGFEFPRFGFCFVFCLILLLLLCVFDTTTPTIAFNAR